MFAWVRYQYAILQTAKAFNLCIQNVAQMTEKLAQHYETLAKPC